MSYPVISISTFIKTHRTSSILQTFMRIAVWMEGILSVSPDSNKNTLLPKSILGEKRKR